jgi:guanylate kinase
MAGTIYVLSGVSGSGKSTISDALIARHPSMRRAVTVTTRSPRQGERYAYHYFFVSQELFSWLVETEQLLEHTEVYNGHRYGTLRYSVEQIIAANQDVLFVVDSKGVEQICAIYPNACSVFLEAPSEDEQRIRLEQRGTVGKDLDDRTAKAAAEHEWAVKRGMTIVINDVLEDAIRETELGLGITTAA